MDEMRDTYKTIKRHSDEILYKEKGSKFYGFAYPIRSPSEANRLIADLRKKHPSANHICYAWQFGIEPSTYRVNDDGEPNNSAGLPIYGQIRAYELCNVLVAVVREFGGTKLGVGGLIKAYRASAKMALDSTAVIERTVKTSYSVGFPYSEMDKVMRIIKKNNFQIVAQKMDLECSMDIVMRKRDEELFVKQINALTKVEIKAKK